jgi:hypothetical protein
MTHLPTSRETRQLDLLIVGSRGYGPIHAGALEGGVRRPGWTGRVAEPRGAVMRGRHVPLLCGSCQAPTSCQEDTCWRCGARVRRADVPQRRTSSRRQRTRRGPHRSRPASTPLSHARRRGKDGPPAGPSRAEDHARWQHERTDARDRDRQVELELADAVEAGDAAYRRLRRRLDEYGTRLDAVHARLYGDAPARASRASRG